MNECQLVVHEVRSATASDTDDIIEILVTAFTTDPLAQLLHPDPVEYKIKYIEMFRDIIINQNSDGKLVLDVTTNLNGCAIWYPPHVESTDTNPPLSSRQEVIDYFHAIKSSAPMNEPYWYLAFIGVSPKYEGIGTILLKHRLSQITGLVAFWTGNETTIAFYQRFGFEVYSHCEINSLKAWWLTNRLP